MHLIIRFSNSTTKLHIFNKKNILLTQKIYFPTDIIFHHRWKDFLETSVLICMCKYAIYTS